MNPDHLPSYNTINEYFQYDESTGNLIWKIKRKRANVGQVAGHIDSYGYIVIGINKQVYKAHRIVWFIKMKEWPSSQLDHINNIKTDNRIENLRLATPRQNKQNTPIHKNNTSGVKGVSWSSALKKWKASIRIENNRIHIGYFETVKEAEVELIAKRKKLHKDFARNK